MAKPSIFSRDYEKKMRRRKIKIIISISVVAVIAGILIYKFKIEDMNFSNVRAKLQAWVDSDDKEKVNDKEEVKPIEEKKEPPKKTYIDAKLNDKETLKCEYKTEGDKKEFLAIENSKDITYNISPNKQMIVVLEKNQDMKLIHIDGKITNITKKEYVSKKGSKFLKGNILKQYKDYKWGVEPRFIDDEHIAYISNLPYFGTAATKEYVWVYNIKDKTYNISWKTGGKEIEFGKVVPKKGIEIKIDKKEYIIDNKGSILQ